MTTGNKSGLPPKARPDCQTTRQNCHWPDCACPKQRMAGHFLDSETMRCWYCHSSMEAIYRLDVECMGTEVEKPPMSPSPRFERKDNPTRAEQ